MQFKRNLLNCKKWVSNPIDTGRKLNVHKTFNLRPVSMGKLTTAVRLFLLQLSFTCNPAFYFNTGKKV